MGSIFLLLKRCKSAIGYGVMSCCLIEYGNSALSLQVCTALSLQVCTALFPNQRWNWNHEPYNPLNIILSLVVYTLTSTQGGA